MHRLKYFRKINVVRGTRWTWFWKTICCNNLGRKRWEYRLTMEFKRRKTQKELSKRQSTNLRNVQDMEDD